MKPKVSVIMPVCDVEDYLEQCLNSICEQTLKEIEIICVDDKSEDGSLAILHLYQQRDDRIVVLENEHRIGAANSRNRGLKIARGEYLSILDADDIFDAKMLEMAYLSSVQENADICAYDFWEFDSNTGKTIRRGSQPIWSSLNSRGKEMKDDDAAVVGEQEDRLRIFYVGGAWQKLYRRGFIAENRIYFQSLPNANDVYFCSMTLLLAKKMVYLHRPLVHYRTNRQGQTRGKLSKYPLSLYQALVFLHERIVFYGCLEKFKREYNSLSIDLLVGVMKEMTVEARNELYHRMVEDGLRSLGFSEIQEGDFLYYRDYWLACKIFEANSVEELLAVAKSEKACWHDRLVWGFGKLKQIGLATALWGYGEVGKLWLQEAQDCGYDFQCVIDEDPAKRGLKTGAYVIVPYESCPEEVEAVVINNPKYLDEILSRIRKGKKPRAVIDFRSFLQNIGKEIENCIYH